MLRVITWNCQRAAAASKVWDYFLELAPDVALLQEVSEIPDQIQGQFACAESAAMGKSSHRQLFKTMLLVKGRIADAICLTGSAPWVNAELERFSGNLLARELILESGERMKAISVYSPAWPVDRSRLSGLDDKEVRLIQNPNVWAADVLLTGLHRADLKSGDSWVIAGDFNLSETFDAWRGGPRGNREYLDRMAELGLVECLRHYKGALTPTFRNRVGGAVKHQIDHIFVTDTLTSRLTSCDVGSQERVFGSNLSDHLPIVADFRPMETPAPDDVTA